MTRISLIRPIVSLKAKRRSTRPGTLFVIREIRVIGGYSPLNAFQRSRSDDLQNLFPQRSRESINFSLRPFFGDRHQQSPSEFRSEVEGSCGRAEIEPGLLRGFQYSWELIPALQRELFEERLVEHQR